MDKKTLDNTVIIAIIAFVGTFVGYLFDSYNRLKQEKREFESTLIINAVKSGNSDMSKNNLRFLIDANIISDKAQHIRLNKIIQDSTYEIPKVTWLSRPLSDSVFICLNSTSKMYHYSKSCKALNSCNSIIEKVTLYKAQTEFQRRLCRFEN